MRNKLSWIIYVIIGLAVIGLFSQLFKNTVSFFTSIFIMIGVALVLYGIVYFVFLKKSPTNSDEMKKYKQAVKQSKSKYKTKNQSNFKVISKNKTQPTKRRKSKRRPTHLRVIEGNKSKGKNRATF